jgi:NitT/TauT family transport system permease protein
MKNQKLFYNQYDSIIHLLIVFAFWHASALFMADEFLLPTPIQAGYALYEKILDVGFFHAFFSSISTLFFSFLLGFTFLVFFCFCSIFTKIRKFLKTLCGIFGPLPSFAVLPAMLIIFGITTKTMFALLIYSMLWINLSYGITAIEQALQKWQPHCQNLKLPINVCFFKIYLPCVLPYFLNMAKNCWILCWRTLLAVEVVFGNLGSGAGIGMMMTMDRVNFKSADIWGMIILIGLLGFLISLFFDKLIDSIQWNKR